LDGRFHVGGEEEIHVSAFFHHLVKAGLEKGTKNSTIKIEKRLTFDEKSIKIQRW
jgi:hypothetical protein